MAFHASDNFFDRFFPIPEFLSTPSFGLDVGDDTVKFIELRNTKEGLRVGRHGERPLAVGVIESGKIKNGTKMEEILSSLRSEVGLKSVRVSLPEEQVYLFKLKLDKDGLESVRESIELSLEEHVPVQATEAIFDYEVLNEDEKNLEIQVAVIPKTVIEGYLNVFKNSNIAVQSFELQAQAIARSVVKEGDFNTYMIVDFGQKRTGIFIISRGVGMFTSTIDVGGVMLNEMIMKNFKISFEEAERMKRKYGLQRNAENRELFSVLLNSVSILRDEIAKHFLYWHTHKDEEGKSNIPIKKIILCGGDSNLIGLVEYFSVSMKTPVEMANVWVNIHDTDNYVPEMNFKQALSFAAPLGLALRDYEIE